MEIDVKLSEKSINSAIRELKSLKKKLEKNIDIANNELVQLGKMQLSNELSSISDRDGNALGEIKEPVVTGENALLVWSGSQITYLEYGTGLVGQGTYSGNLPSDYRYAVGKVIQKNIREKNDPYWEYSRDKIKTYGIPAQAPMLKTAYFMRNNVFNVYNKILSKGGSQ